MEILMLVLLYYFSQNPAFAESVKPLMDQIKNSEQMLAFLKNLSCFAETFHFKEEPKSDKKETPPKKEEKKEEPHSPTDGIADSFIQSILDSYFKK